MTQSFTILLPVINETESLKKTIQIIETQNKEEKLIFSFLCSKALTSKDSIDICENYKKIDEFKYKIIFQNRKGLGGAFIDSFSNLNTTHAIMMASDLETDPETVKNLIKISKININSIICTSRWINKNSFSEYGLIKKILNFIFQKFFGIVFKVDLSDLTFGFRLYPTSILKDIEWEINNFGFLFESIIKPVHLGYKTLEIATKWRKREEGVSSNNLMFYIAYFYIAFKIKMDFKRR